MDRIAQGGVILMDGAVGTELERRGVPVDATAWSAVAMIEHADTLRAVHADFIKAGAEIQIVNSFALGRQVLEPAGYGGQVASFNQGAVALCMEAVVAAASDRPLWIAGSLSSFAAGGDRSKLPQGPVLRANYREQASLLHDAGVDLLALEMLCDVDITLDAVTGALPTGLPLMLGFTCQWGADGETVEILSKHTGLAPLRLDDVLDAVLPAVPADRPLICAIMHSGFDVTGAALRVLSEKWPGPTAVYPNSGGFRDLRLDFDSVCPPEVFADAAENWVAMGVQIVGGCCGLGPEHIQALHRRLARGGPP